MTTGYTFLYGLINFAILAAGLFFIGRKLIPKMLGGRKTQIEEALKSADEASANAKILLSEIDGVNAAAEIERADILDAARQAAVPFRRGG